MCIFCSIINGEIPSKKVYEDEHVLAILDISQTTYGHTLLMPKKHVKDILEVDSETMSHIARVLPSLTQKIVKNTKALGVNILSNANEVAGQSVDHLHFHIIPRYSSNDGFSFSTTNHSYNLDEVLKTITKEA